MVDIVYVVGKGAKKYNDLPLRWSLRSVERFASNVGRIIVSGYPPDWLSDIVIKVHDEQTHAKHLNMLLSIAAAVKQVHLTQQFLFSADDHYFAQHVDLDKWPRYFLGDLPSLKQWKMKNKDKKDENGNPLKPSKWYMNLFQTRYLLKAEGFTARRGNMHADTWIDPADIDDAVAFSMKYKDKCPLGIEPQCILNALYDKRMANIGVDVKYIKYKADRKVKTAEECQKVIKDKLLAFSSDATAEQKNKEMIAWMNGFFAFPSKYEK